MNQPRFLQTPEAASREAARLVAESLRAALAARGVAHLALSGGKSPARMLELLAADLKALGPTLDRLHVWQVDERMVPPQDERSNQRLLRAHFVDKLGAKVRFHPMPVAQDGHETYEAELRAVMLPPPPPDFADETDDDGQDEALCAASRPDLPIPRMDAVVLGLGPDGHTASLFPGRPALAEDVRLVVLEPSPGLIPDVPRLTLSLPMLAAARLVVFLVLGADKGPALAGVLRPGSELPPALLQARAAGRVAWIACTA